MWGGGEKLAPHERVRSLFRAGVLDASLIEESVRSALLTGREDEEAELAAQQDLHRAVFDDPISLKCPPPRTARKCMLKCILATLEGGGVLEVDDQLYAACVEGLAEAGAAFAAGLGDVEGVQYDGYKTLEVPSCGPIVLRVTAHMGGPVETGCWLWSAGCALFGLLVAGALDDMVHGHVLELGSGTGILGLGLARRGSPVASVTLTDGEAAVVENLRHNVEETVVLQGLGTRAEVQILEWGAAELSSPFLQTVDVVIGGDVAYDIAYIPSLVGLLRRLLRPEGSATRAVLGIARRCDETFGLLLQELDREGLRCREMEFSEEVWSGAIAWTRLANDFGSLVGGSGSPRSRNGAALEAWRGAIRVLQVDATPQALSVAGAA